MALNLNIPTLQDDFFSPAAISPKEIKKSLSALDASTVAEIAAHIRNELESLNHHALSPGDRLNALDCYRPYLQSTALKLSVEYTHSTLPLSEQAKLAASTVEALWLQLGYGYKLALIDLQNQLIKFGTDKTSARAIQLAIDAVTEYALVHYQTYATPPDSVWSDLHQLYFCAVQLGIQNVQIKDASAVENLYKYALLISLAETQHLAPGDISLLAEYLYHHVALAQITAVTSFENSTGLFVISLDSDNPPVPYIKKKADPNPATDIILHSLDLVHAIHTDLSQLRNNQRPKNNSIPPNANIDDYNDLLSHLIKHWGITPKRIFTRSEKTDDIDLVAGITAFHHISNEMLTPATGHHQLTHTEALRSDSPGLSPSRWRVLNISATGTLLRRHHTAEKNIRVGCLIGTKAKDDQHWSVGIVRWANCGTRDRLDIGVQLIAPYAECAIANINDRNKEELVLLIAEMAAMKLSATIIAPRGTYAPARQLTLTYQGKIQQIMLTKLIERTHHIERIQYSIIS